jgi:hypothetical protein
MCAATTEEWRRCEGDKTLPGSGSGENNTVGQAHLSHATQAQLG